MFCSKCGKDLPDGTRFCPKCGATVSAQAEKHDPDNAPAPEVKSATTVKERPPKDQKRTALLIALFAVVLVAAVILVLFRIMNTEGDSSMPPDDSAMTDDATLDDDAAEQDPGAELLAILDQVEAVQQETNDAYGAVSESEDIEVVERYRQMAQIYKSFVADLDALRVQADAVNGLDAKLKAAKDEYFTMLHDARTAHAEMIDILADYLELSRDYLQWRPSSFDYDTIGEYSEAYIEWAQNTSDAFAAISYPACVEDVWKRYGVVLEYNEYIAAKIALANQSGDWLRYYSTKSLESLCEMMDNNQYRRLYNCLEGERDHANNQFSIASALAGEIRAYTEMTPEEKDAYEFAYIRTGKIIVNYDVVDTIYPSLYNTYDAFAIFKTGCISGKRTIIIEAEIEGFTQQYRESFNLDSSYKEIYIKPPALTGELDLSAAKPAQLKITISEQDGTPLDTKSFPVTLKSKYDFDWYNDAYGTAAQYNILCYLTPESSAITQLKRAAIDEIGTMTGGRVESFAGYQNINSKWNRHTITYLQAAGLMHALSADLGVRYSMNPFSISGSNQHIQLPEDVIANRSGLCVETALVIASALQSANMHAFLLFPPGHAQVAVEVWNSGEGVGEYFLIETTSLDSSYNTLSHFIENANNLLANQASTGIITYYTFDEWADYLANSVEYVVDCNDSRLLGMTPFAN